MGKNRKYFPHDSVILVTTRTEVGLPMVASFLMNFFIWGILARASSKYQVKICHFLFMSNHFHMMLVVDNPEHVSEFVGYVKCEIAHVINKLLGRRQRTIWQDGYDSPLILTVEDVKKYIRYIYLNPVKATLVDKIRDFPGVSSWYMFSNQINTQEHKKISRSSIRRLEAPAISINEQKRLVDFYQNEIGKDYQLKLEPFAWLDCFPGLSAADKINIRLELLDDIALGEDKCQQQRRVERREVIGSTRLRRESMLKEYTPQKYGRRSICISYNKELKKALITHYRSLCDQASNVYRSWKLGLVVLKLPPGLFAPRMPNLSSALSLLI